MQVVNYDVFYIKRLIFEYDRLCCEITRQKRKPRPVLSILKATPIWEHMRAMIKLSVGLRADPFTFLAVQFKYCNKPPFSTQLANEYAVKTYNLWLEEQQRKYASSSAEAITAASVTACSDKSVEKALTVGDQIWKALKEAHGDALRPLDVATSASNMLPPQFLLSFKEVEEAVRSGVIQAPTLVAMIELLDQTQNNKLWEQIRTWQKANHAGNASV